MFVLVFALVVVILCWWMGDLGFRTKVILTLLYGASFGLLLVKDAPYLFWVAQCALVAVIGGATFGVDWLRGRRY